MRLLALTVSFLLVACASTPFSTIKPVDGGMAALTVPDRVNYPFNPRFDGIVSVDARDVPQGPVRQLWVSAGSRVIGYNCPGWVTVDGPATIAHTFTEGSRYVLTCENPPAIQPAK